MTGWRSWGTRVPAPWLWGACIAAAFVLLAQRGPLVSDYDDMMYLHALREQSLVAWLGGRYAAWSGRVGIDAVTLLVIPHVWLWRGVSAVLLGALLWAMAALLRGERDARLALCLMLGFLLFEPRTLFQSVLWVTGSFNYLWPAALGALALLPFVRPEFRGRHFLWSIPAAAYACFQEQAALLLLAFQLLLLARLVHGRQASAGHWIQLAVCGMAFAVVLLAPGQVRRFDVMVQFWFPEYQQLSTVERLFSGLQLGLGHAFGLGRGMFPLLFAGMLLWACTALRSHWSDRVLAAVPLVVLVLPWLLALGYRGEGPCAGAAECLRKYTGLLRYAPYQDFWIGQGSNATDVWLYVSLFMGAVAAMAVALVLDLLFRPYGPWIRALAVLVWLAALAATTALGMTPSLYLSGFRVFFLQDLLMLGLLGAVFQRGRMLRRGAAASQVGERPA